MGVKRKEGRVEKEQFSQLLALFGNISSIQTKKRGKEEGKRRRGSSARFLNSILIFFLLKLQHECVREIPILNFCGEC